MARHSSCAKRTSLNRTWCEQPLATTGLWGSPAKHSRQPEQAAVSKARAPVEGQCHNVTHTKPTTVVALSSTSHVSSGHSKRRASCACGRLAGQTQGGQSGWGYGAHMHTTLPARGDNLGCERCSRQSLQLAADWRRLWPLQRRGSFEAPADAQRDGPMPQTHVPDNARQVPCIVTADVCAAGKSLPALGPAPGGQGSWL